jgi:nucleotide-binding universal stress UspA family protein
VFRNLLVGIDDSASAAHALTQAIEMARESGGRLGLLSVAATPAPGVSLALPPSALPTSKPQLAVQLVAQAQRRLDHAALAVPTEVPITKLLAHGNATRALLEHAQQGPWDLIVIGHHASTDRRWSRRSVAARLLDQSPLPVLVATTAAEVARARTSGTHHNQIRS